MKLRKSTSLLIAAILTISGAASGSATIESVGDPGRFWSVPLDGELGQVIMQFLDNLPGENSSSLVSNQGYERYPLSDPTCDDLQDSKCSSGNIRYQAIVPFCTGPADVNCTEDVGVIDEAGKKTSAVFNRYFPTTAQNQFAGDIRYNLPSGVAGSIFSIPSAAHDGGDSYYLSVIMAGFGRDLNSIRLNDFSIQLSPIKLEPTTGLASDKDAGWGIIKAGTPGNPTGKDVWINGSGGSNGTSYCIASSYKEGLCAQRYAHPAGVKFYVKVRTQQSPGGWMHGRISDPEIQLTESSGSTSIEVQAFPIAVPAVYKMYRYPEMPQKLKDEYDVTTGAYKKDPNFLNNPTNYVQGGRTAEDPDPLKRNNIYGPTPSSPAGMEQLKLWIPFINDKATALLSFWSVRTLTQGEMEGSSQCFRDSNRVSGIVTTNATQYSAGPPTLDKVEGTLNYVVAAPHYDPRDKDFKGSYDLVMRSDVARCVYGFSKAPINATISITSDDGTPQVATTLIGERNGWLYLQAKNFEFSAPVIKAKLTQEVVVEPTPTPTATPTPTKKPVVAKKTTISCVKGKTVKKVTAVSPKCPTGYKVKK
jgi:hypothetical protein